MEFNLLISTSPALNRHASVQHPGTHGQGTSGASPAPSPRQQPPSHSAGSEGSLKLLHTAEIEEQKVSYKMKTIEKVEGA